MPVDPASMQLFDWKTVQTWKHVLKEVQILRRPGNMKGFEQVMDLHTLVAALMPWALRDEPGPGGMTGMSNKKQKKLARLKRESEDVLDKLLTKLKA